MSKTKYLAAVLSAVLLLSACADPGTPVEPAAIATVDRPLPAGVTEGAEPQPDPPGAECNATASLRPDAGTSIASGSTMDKIKERGQLIVGVDQTAFLLGYRNPVTSELEGFDIDIATEVAKEIFGPSYRNHLQFVAITSGQREDVLKQGRVDIVVRTYSITCGRLKDIAFSSVYYQAGQRVLAPRNANVRGLADLAGKRVCSASGSTSAKKVAADPNNPVLVSVANWSDCLVLLQQGQVEAVSTDDTILAGMAAQDPTTVVVGDAFSVENYGIGVPKQNTDMVKFVNAVLEKVRSGPWQQSYDRWLKPALDEQPKTPPNPTYK